jgi:hypothetical protein
MGSRELRARGRPGCRSFEETSLSADSPTLGDVAGGEAAVPDLNASTLGRDPGFVA